MKIKVIDRSGQSLELPFEPGTRLMEVLAEQSLVEATCGGECSCGTCQVYVDTQWTEQLPPKGEFELELLDALLHTQENSRLACQIPLSEELDGISVTVAPPEH